MRKTTVVVMSATAVLLQLTFSNCGRMGVDPELVKGTADSASLSADVPSLGSGDTNRKLLTADQIQRSFADLTGVSVFNEVTTSAFKASAAILPDDFNVRTTTSPYLVAVTNLASDYCDQSIKQSTTGAGSIDGLPFRSLPLESAVNQLDGINYKNYVQALAKRFWGRSASAEELQAFVDARAEFVAGIESNPSSPAHTRALALFVCSAMLSSFDTITF